MSALWPYDLSPTKSESIAGKTLRLSQMTVRQKASQKLATQVQTIETSDLSSVPKNFRIQCSGGNEDEITASAELYRHIDDVQGSSTLDNFESCRTRAFFSVSRVTRKVRVASNSCRLRWCPLCSQALTRYRTHSITEWLGDQSTTRFLTLTVKHTDEDLAQQINRIYYYFKQLRKIKYFKQVVTGGIWFFQVKRSRLSGEWHPHLHCLVTGSYIVHPRLSEVWERITGGSTVVDIRTIEDESAIAKYVSRYSSRPAVLNDYGVTDRAEIFSALHNRRLCGRWGTGRSCSLTAAKCVDLSEWQKIGSWRSIVHHAPFHAYSRIVFKCWKQNRAIPGFIDLHCLDCDDSAFTSSDMVDLTMLQAYEDDDL